MSKTKTIISWILAALISTGFLFAGITKLSGAEMQIKNFESWGYPLWLRFPVGVCELTFAFTILIPKYRKVTLFTIFIWMVVAIITHLQARQASMISGPVLFGILAGVILLLQPKKTSDLAAE